MSPGSLPWRGRDDGPMPPSAPLLPLPGRAPKSKLELRMLLRLCMEDRPIAAVMPAVAPLPGREWPLWLLTPVPGRPGRFPLLSLLSLIAVISLLVGGIGVMNIMLVSVTERTREIGIRMAVGARQSDIRQQFLVEAVMVCLIGGLIGISLSYALGFLFSLFVKEWEMVFSLGSIITAFACSTLIGIVFGFVPARNAARLDPIEALARD